MNFLKFGNSRKFLIFLHGWGADKNSFLWLKNYFSDYTKVFVDFAGFGETIEPKTPYHLSDYVNDLKILIENFELNSNEKIEELVLVGHSFGGRVAIKFSFLYQNNYEKFRLCLVDAAGLKPRHGFSYYYKVYKYKIYKKLFPSSKKLLYFGSSDYKVLSLVMKQTFVSIVNEDLTNCARVISAKTLIIWGEKDKETKMYMAKKLKRLIKNSSLEVISGAGHFSFLDKPMTFAIILDSFLKKQ